MGGITTDRTDPRLGRGGDDAPTKQNEVYLVLSDEERRQGFLKPYRDTYRHKTCGGTTTINSRPIAETYARDPWFYGSTWCCHCNMHRSIAEFTWLDGEEMHPVKWTDEEKERVRLLKTVPAPVLREVVPDRGGLDVPRRCIVDKLTPAEVMIRNAMLAVESLGADERLTAAVSALQKARTQLADYIDDIPFDADRT